MKENRNTTEKRKGFGVKLLCLVTAGLLWSGSLLPAGAVPLLAADSATVKTVRQYTFDEVGDIAENNGSDVVKQKSTLEQAELKEDETSLSYQIAVYNYWYAGGTGDESSSAYSALYSLQTSYESAENSASDAAEALELLKPKVRYDAEKLYISLLMGEKAIALQEKNLEAAKAGLELETVKLGFGNSTQAAVETAKLKAEEAEKSLETLKSTQTSNEVAMRVYLDLNEGEAFALVPTPTLGEYTTSFETAAVQKNALANSLALKQAQRNLDKLDDQIEAYQRMGKTSQADQLAVSGTSTQISQNETIASLKSKVTSTLEALTTAKKNLSTTKSKYEQAQIDYLTSQLKYGMGSLTKSALQSAEQAQTTTANNYEQAQYDYYFAARKVSLLNQGILAN